MAEPKCVKCGGSTFDISERTFPGKSTAISFVHCADARCNAVIGVSDSATSSVVGVSRKESFKMAFIAADEDFRKLHHAIEEFAGDPKYRVQCSDHLEWKNSTLSDLLAMENPPTRQILGVHIEVTANTPRRGVAVALQTEGEKIQRSKDPGFQLADEQEGPNVWISIEGPPDGVLRLNQLINDRLVAMNPWYSMFTKRKSTSGLAIAVATVTLVWACAKVWRILGLPTGDSWGLLVIVGLIAVGVLMVKIRNETFPAASFLIGQGKKRHDAKELIRSAVFMGFLVSFGSSVLVLLIF